MTDIIGYPVVGEQIKQDSNVVDYNIREEQSISEYSVLTGASSVSNGEANTVYGVNEPKIIADTSIVGGASGGAEIVEISDYQSIEERQPVVDKILEGKFVMVLTMFTEFSRLTKLYFIPVTSQSNRIKFQNINASDTWRCCSISCWMENGDGRTVTTVGTAQYTK